VVVDQDQADRQPGLRPGLYVTIAVNDTGSGMDRETRERAFDPFFTTKEKGRGTGLGLSTVSGIVKQAGGNVSLFSEPGRGTSVRVFLPMVGEVALIQNTDTQVFDDRGSGEVILLVEDEEAVRRLVRATLERRGYHVLVASDGPEALQIERQAEHIDLVLTDLVMPQMSGMEVARRVRESRPGTRVLFMSGYTDRSLQETGQLPDEIEVLQKPFTSAVLAARVRRALENGWPDLQSRSFATISTISAWSYPASLNDWIDASLLRAASSRANDNALFVFASRVRARRLRRISSAERPSWFAWATCCAREYSH